MKLHAEPKPLTGPIAGAAAGATVVVEPLRVGEVQLPAAFFEGGGPLEGPRSYGIGVPRSRWPRVPCQAFLIHHPGAGPLLVDTGLHQSITAKPTANMGRLMARYARPRLEPGQDLPAQLRSRGFEPGDLRTIVMTHLHFDHASGMASFPHATFIVGEAEWRAATGDSRPILRGYRPEHYDYVFDYRTLSFDSGVSSYATFGRTFDLFGDGSVRIAFTPGHSPGHLSVICRLRERDLVIAGDALNKLGQLDDTPLPPRPADPHTFRRSLLELRRFRDRYPQALIIPSHDAELWERLEKRYE